MQLYVFETTPFKILPFSTHNADQKAIKNSSSCMFNANTIPSWSYVSHISGFTACSTAPKIHQTRSKTEISYAII